MKTFYPLFEAEIADETNKKMLPWSNYGHFKNKIQFAVNTMNRYTFVLLKKKISLSEVSNHQKAN